MPSHFSRRCRLTVALAVALAGCAAAPSESRIDNIPMYGQPGIARPEALRKADEDFIREASVGFDGDRKAASKAWAAQGDRFMQAMNLDYAMRRYNQSWLLSPTNYQPYWGFGRVLIESGKFEEAIQHFETAKKLCDDDYQRVALLSDTGVAYSLAHRFDLANENFRQSTALDSQYAGAWGRWSESLYRQGDYAGAWTKLKQARSLGAVIPDRFTRALTEKMPEP